MRVWLAFIAVLATACSGSGSGLPPDDGGPSASPSPAPAPGPAEATVTPDSRPVTISLAGDVHFEGRLSSLLDNPGTALEPLADQLSAADLTVVNLETAIGVGGNPEPKRFTFQASPTAFDALAAAGVDVVTMANNHAADYGLDGLHQAIDAATSDPSVSVVGIGSNVDEAFAPGIVDLHGTTVAVVGASAADLDPTADPTSQWAARADRAGTADATDPDRLLDMVRTVRSDVDIVLVYLHWGVQGESCPSDDQEDLAQTLVDAGADIVVGSHAHRLQGSGTLEDSYVGYGLGNFVWYTQSSNAAATTGLLTLTVEDGTVVDEDWAPARIGSSGLPEFVAGSDADQLTADFDELRECTNLAPLN